MIIRIHLTEGVYNLYYKYSSMHVATELAGNIGGRACNAEAFILAFSAYKMSIVAQSNLTGRREQNKHDLPYYTRKFSSQVQAF